MTVYFICFHHPPETFFNLLQQSRKESVYIFVVVAIILYHVSIKSGKKKTNKNNNNLLLMYCMYKFQIKFRKRVKDKNRSTCKLTLNVTDCPILKPRISTGNFSSRWYSHKFKVAGVWYKIWMNILTGPLWKSP